MSLVAHFGQLGGFQVQDTLTGEELKTQPAPTIWIKTCNV